VLDQTGKGEILQFSRSLHFIPEKRRGEGQEERRFFGVKQQGPWLSGTSGSRGFLGGHGGRLGSSGSPSDSRTWRKDMEVKEKGEDNTSQTKTMLVPAGNDLPAKKPLLLQLDDPAIAAAADGRGVVKGGVDDGKKRRGEG
jgi:hypothetical protein